MNSYFIISFFGAFLAAFSQYLLKSSANTKHMNVVKEYLNVRVITAYFLLGCSLLANTYAYRGIDYRFAPVFAAATYIFSLVLARVLLKEEIKSKIFGNVLIVIGILISIMEF
ncbi:MAG: multidrug ABC transporter [Clostridiaceae bacterium]|nr:multidrug ABC transporter [Clostridiaceae bacterium]